MSAFVWRRLLLRTKFVVISGSVGKTTTKEILAAILESHYPTARTPGNCNHRKFGGPEATILSVRPWHRFAVIEVGIERPGDMASVARLVKPDIALMLEVKRCHTNVFKTVEAIAEEKGALIEALPAQGIAVLNQDNPHVANMIDRSKARAVGFGRGQQAQLRLLDMQCAWPSRLTLKVEMDGKRYDVNTRLVGKHWSTAIMAALTAATVCGVPLEQAIETVGTIEPFWARMQPMTLPGSNAVLIRDEWNGSIDTFEAAFEFMADARAKRKIVVLSDYSDTTTKLRVRANRLGRRVTGFSDMAIFVGEYAERSAAAAIEDGFPEDQVHCFVTMDATSEFLRAELREGDLVLLKGQANHHLSRIYLGLLGNVTCTTLSCSRQILCDRCDNLGMSWKPELKDLMADAQSFV